MIKHLHKIFSDMWLHENIPADLKIANMSILYKKGAKSLCGNYRGISLLSVVGKHFADILLQRLQKVLEPMYPQFQSG